MLPINRRTLEETDALLDQLRDQDSIPYSAPPSSQSVPASHVANQVAEGTKFPKDDKTIIEELEVANSHLRRMVDSLFVELDYCQRENKELKERIKHMEMELRNANSNPRRNRQYNDQEQEQLLPPLEMPTFNFDTS